MILDVSHIVFHDPECVSNNLALSNSILHSFHLYQKAFMDRKHSWQHPLDSLVCPKM